MIFKLVERTGSMGDHGYNDLLSTVFSEKVFDLLFKEGTLIKYSNDVWSKNFYPKPGFTLVANNWGSGNKELTFNEHHPLGRFEPVFRNFVIPVTSREHGDIHKMTLKDLCDIPEFKEVAKTEASIFNDNRRIGNTDTYIDKLELDLEYENAIRRIALTILDKFSRKDLQNITLDAIINNTNKRLNVDLAYYEFDMPNNDILTLAFNKDPKINKTFNDNTIQDILSNINALAAFKISGSKNLVVNPESGYLKEPEQEELISYLDLFKTKQVTEAVNNNTGYKNIIPQLYKLTNDFRGYDGASYYTSSYSNEVTTPRKFLEDILSKVKLIECKQNPKIVRAYNHPDIRLICPVKVTLNNNDVVYISPNDKDCNIYDLYHHLQYSSGLYISSDEICFFNPSKPSTLYTTDPYYSGDLVLPSNITTLRAYSINSNSNIKKLVIPESVKLIEKNGISNNDFLEEIVIEGSDIKLEEIAIGCKNLKSLTIKGVSSILKDSIYHFNGIVYTEQPKLINYCKKYDIPCNTEMTDFEF